LAILIVIHELIRYLGKHLYPSAKIFSASMSAMVLFAGNQFITRQRQSGLLLYQCLVFVFTLVEFLNHLVGGV